MIHDSYMSHDVQKRHLRSVLRAQINLNPPYCWDEMGMLNSYEVNHSPRAHVIKVVLQFPDPIKDADSVILETPLGFDIAGNPATKGCKKFAWKD